MLQACPAIFPFTRISAAVSIPSNTSSRRSPSAGSGAENPVRYSQSTNSYGRSRLEFVPAYGSGTIPARVRSPMTFPGTFAGIVFPFPSDGSFQLSCHSPFRDCIIFLSFDLLIDYFAQNNYPGVTISLQMENTREFFCISVPFRGICGSEAGGERGGKEVAKRNGKLFF